MKQKGNQLKFYKKKIHQQKGLSVKMQKSGIQVQGVSLWYR
jgi:hypothetical protein